MIKYIFVTGGVVSGLGKGITAASLGMLLKARGFKVIAQKLDPYINMDPGTMSPFQHGEVFVTEDGAETDLDLGHYERFIDENMNKYSNITTGKIYYNVLENERRGIYNGETVQVIPHITDEIKKFIYSVGKKINADVVITEIGGTVGDIESLAHIEAIRQVSNDVGRENCLFVHVTLAPVITGSEEMKTKPTQHSVKQLRSLGISPNVIVLRCDRPIDKKTREKIALYCNVEPDCVIENRDVQLLYDLPVMLEKTGLTDIVVKELSLSDNPSDMAEWESMLVKARNLKHQTRIALVGKYVKMYDAYISVTEALKHAGIYNGTNIEIKWVDAEKITASSVRTMLGDCDGVIVPGGFGDRGIEGMIQASRYCRENNVPYFGICLGMQVAVIDFARHAANIAGADSREFNPSAADKVIDIMEGQAGYEHTGGSMRLGAYECVIAQGTRLQSIYNGAASVMERHRHRYEFSNKYRSMFEKLGMVFSGLSPDGNLVEVVELPDKRFFTGCQYHPEFKSRPHRPHPLFREFIAASLKE